MLLTSLTERLLGRAQAAPDQRSDCCICGRVRLLMLAPSIDGREHLVIESNQLFYWIGLSG
jgi:hypothetical protein